MRDGPRVGGAAICALLLAPVAAAHEVTIYVQGPSDDWCTFINEEIEPGDMVRLLPGDYVGPCELVGRETEEDSELTMIQALDFQARPRFLHPGADAPYVLRITGTSIAVLDAVFEDVPADAVAVQVEADSHAWLRFNDFRGVAGTAVEVRSGSDVRVQDNWFEDVGQPAVFGCASGDCPVPELVFGGNVLAGGPGAVVHPGTSGRVFDNIGAELTSPLVRYLGDGGVIEANFASASGPALEVSGDDVVVRNNVVVGELVADGVGAQIVGNSIVGDIVADASSSARHNAVTARIVPGDGNVHCADPAGCWEDADGWDFRPVVGGLLHETGSGDAALDVDFCGSARGAPPDVGAIERTEGADPLVLDFKRVQRCTGPGLPEQPPGELEEPDDERPADDPGGCGCAGVPRAAGVGGWLIGALLLGARRRTTRSRVRAR